jgi:hypothetical protein
MTRQGQSDQFRRRAVVRLGKEEGVCGGGGSRSRGGLEDAGERGLEGAGCGGLGKARGRGWGRTVALLSQMEDVGYRLMSVEVPAWCEGGAGH